jgi:Uma2 family endonuclease
MSTLVEFENKGYQDVGSLNHSIAQARLTTLLSTGNEDRFTVMVELSLDASQIENISQFGIKAKEELKPDICLYPNSVWFSEPTDILRMLEMPLLVIEVISPKQGFDDILAKFTAYFALGVKSCWLVMPAVKSIAVYSQPNDFKNFDMNDSEVIDEVIDIHLPLQKIFRR